MRKTTMAVLAVASVALGGCVAVPAYDPYYAPAPAYGYGPGPVVVQPSISFGYSRYYGGYYGGPYHHYRHWR
jgi:hypothetical protein